MRTRADTRTVTVGGVPIGGGHPVTVQSMTTTDTRDAAATIEQIKRLEDAGCEIVRVAVPDLIAAKALTQIKKAIRIPLIADIHFDYRLALAAVENGVDKLRLNPGNIGDENKVFQVAQAAKAAGVPMRIGVNSGSLEKDLLHKYGGVTAEGIVESALRHIGLLESCGFYDMIISVKASDVALMVKSYRLLAEKTDYPLHAGVTEAGTPYLGTIRSAVGLGAVLGMDLGDTVRVSLTGDPVEEVRVAKVILQSMKLRRFGVQVVSCPTCGRTEIDLISLAQKVEAYCENINLPLVVAVMGCAVNGPGEAREADFGIAGGRGTGVLFRKGEVIRKLPENELEDALIGEIRAYIQNK